MRDFHAARLVMRKGLGEAAAKRVASSLAKNKHIAELWMRRHDDHSWEIEFFAKCNGVCLTKGGVRMETRSWLVKKVPKRVVTGISVSKDVIWVKGTNK